MLLIDGHDHIFIQKCLDNKVILSQFTAMTILTYTIQILPFCFIPHSMHLCQPLDVAIFSMMQRSYGKLVLRTHKEGIAISKAYFSKLLKEVRDEVLWLSVIIGSFSTCGYFPFSFPLSYAFKQMPPPPLTLEEEEVVAMVEEIEEDEEVIDKILLVVEDENALTPKPRSR